MNIAVIKEPIFSGTRAQKYTSRPQWTEEHIAEILRLAKLPENPVIIDLGSGTGQFTEFILKLRQDAKIYAVEPSKQMRNQAEKRLGRYDNFFSIAADASDFAKEIDNQADFIVASQAAHWWSKPRATSEMEETVIENLRAVSKARTVIAYAYYNLGFANRMSNVGEDIHRILKDSLASYSRNQTELSHANAFRADNFDTQIKGLTTKEAILSPMSHDRASFFDWLQSYSFVDDGALEAGTDLRGKLEKAFDTHSDHNGQVTIPIFAQTHMGLTP